MLIEQRYIWDVEEWVWDRIEWWDREDFRGRVTKLYSGERLGKLQLDAEIPIPDDAIICDFCSEDIEDFPCPVFHGHALCVKCRQKIKVNHPLVVKEWR